MTMKIINTYLFLLFSLALYAQIPERINSQMRYFSDSRSFYVWNPEKEVYDPKDAEYEESIIEIREINTANNGYVILSLTDNGKVRLYHGSIISNSIDPDGNATWVLRSKNARGKVVLSPKNKTITYSFESNSERYLKIFVFNLSYNEMQ